MADRFNPAQILIGSQPPPPAQKPAQKSMEQIMAELQAQVAQKAGEAEAYRRMAEQGLGQQKQEAPPQDNSWSAALGAKNPADKAKTQASLDDLQGLVERTIDQKINQTVQTITTQQNVGNALWADFHTNHADLIPLSNFVGRLIGTYNSQIPLQDRYQAAIREVRSMQDTGALPRYQTPTAANMNGNQGLHGRMPTNLQGGQWNVSQGQPAPGETYEDYGDAYLERVLHEWTQDRRGMLAFRRDGNLLEDELTDPNSGQTVARRYDPKQQRMVRVA